MKAEHIKEFDDDYGARNGGSACLVKLGDEYFVVSSIPSAPDHSGPETLAFPADDEGEVTDWDDVAGGRGWSREKTIAELEVLGPDADSSGRGIFGDTKKQDDREVGELLAGGLSSLGVISDAIHKGDVA